MRLFFISLLAFISGQGFRPEQLIPNVNGVANFILLRAKKAQLEKAEAQA